MANNVNGRRIEDQTPQNANKKAETRKVNKPYNQPRGAVSRERRFGYLTNLDHFISFKNVYDVQIAPNGQEAAFYVGDFVKDNTNSPRSRIWLAPLVGGEARPITSGPRTDIMPRWSPDGKHIAFLSDREENGRFQIHIVPRDCGEARALTQVRGAIRDLAWSPDGASIAFLMDDPETDERTRRKEEKDDSILFEKIPRLGRVWIADVETNKTRLVTEGNLHVWEFSWSHDGERLVMLVADEPYEWSWFVARLCTVSSKGGEASTIFEDKPKQYALPRFSYDGKKIAFLSSIWSDRGVIGGDVWIVDEDGSNPRNLTNGYLGSVSYFHWTTDDQRLISISLEDASAAIVEINLNGQAKTLWSGPVAFGPRLWPQFSISRDQTAIALSRQAWEHPLEVWIARLDSAISWRQLTHVNAKEPSDVFWRVENIHWKSVDDLVLQGFLVSPRSYEKNKPHPLIVVPHGGPAFFSGYRFLGYSYYDVMLVSRGFSLFLPNPRGSLGRGTRFTEMSVGDMGGKDFLDVMSGVDHLVEHGLADPQRLGIYGASYGGYMTAWAVTQTQRFKAAVVLFGITNWLSFHGTTSIPRWDEIYHKADPYEFDSGYRTFSPITHVERVKTPTLILHGEADRIVPVGQGYEFFRGLKDHKVETELVIYPREGHGFLERTHVTDAVTRTLEWFEKHLPPDC